MASTSSIIQAMKEITLEDEEEGGLALEVDEEQGKETAFNGFNATLCLVGHFINEGMVDFPAMQQTLAALWRPGRGVFIKEIDINLYLFQFYHEVDIKRVMDGSPWSFNRKTLIIARMKEGVLPRCINLNALDLWVQVHDLRPGFMTERVLKEVGNYVGSFVETCPRNFTGGWKDYMRVRVTVDLSKPLKRKMKLRRTGEEWVWITFKYENVPTFCFICGLIGHSDRFCSRLFDTPEGEIIKPYGSWMRAPLRKATKLIGARWLRDGGAPPEMEQSGRPTDGDNYGANVATEQIRDNDKGAINAIFTQQNHVRGGSHGISNVSGLTDGMDKGGKNKQGINVIESKKRRTDNGLEHGNIMGSNTELGMDSETEEVVSMEHDNISKNVEEAGFYGGVRLSS